MKKVLAIIPLLLMVVRARSGDKETYVSYDNYDYSENEDSSKDNHYLTSSEKSEATTRNLVDTCYYEGWYISRCGDICKYGGSCYCGSDSVDIDPFGDYQHCCLPPREEMRR